MRMLHFVDRMFENTGGRTLFILEMAAESDRIAVLETDMKDERMVNISDEKGKIDEEKFRQTVALEKPELCIFHTLKNTTHEMIDSLRKNNTGLIFVVHDYYGVCERYTLINNKQLLCSGPYGNNCVHCYIEKYKIMMQVGRQTQDMLIPLIKKVNPVMKYYSDRSQMYADLMSKMDLILFPTDKSQKIMSRFIAHKKSIAHIKPFIKKIESAFEKGDAPVFGYIGHEEYHKGYQVIEDITARIMNNKFKLNIYGEFKEKIKDSRVSYKGVYKYEDIGKVFLEFDILIFPSLWPEVFGRVMCEAASCGKFIFASNLTAAEEILKDYKGLNIFAHNKHDELIKLISKFIMNWGGIQYPVKPFEFQDISEYRAAVEKKYMEVK